MIVCRTISRSHTSLTSVLNFSLAVVCSTRCPSRWIIFAIMHSLLLRALFRLATNGILWDSVVFVIGSILRCSAIGIRGHPLSSPSFCRGWIGPFRCAAHRFWSTIVFYLSWCYITWLRFLQDMLLTKKPSSRVKKPEHRRWEEPNDDENEWRHHRVG